MPIRHSYILAVALTLSPLFIPPPQLRAQSTSDEPKITVDIGWEGSFRESRWNPLFVTITCPGPNRQAFLEVLVSNYNSDPMRIAVPVVAGPTPATYTIYAPLSYYSLNNTVVTLRDAATGRFMAEHFLNWAGKTLNFNQLLNYTDVFIGVSGDKTNLHQVKSQLEEISIRSGYLPRYRLPENPVPYDGVSALVLDKPDFRQFPIEQQQALLDWVRAGGQLILWPGTDPIPRDSPLARALPCAIGDNTVLSLSGQTLSGNSLPNRLAQLTARELTPLPDSLGRPPDHIPLLSNTPGASAFCRRTGTGQIVVVPFDVSSLTFDAAAGAADLWRPLLAGVYDVPNPLPATGTRATTNGWQYKANAIAHNQDVLGDVPGVGRFGFSYIAWLLLAMAAIVGPLDWIILKRLRRQPWTWFTTSGWILLITLSAILIGQRAKSGDLYYRSLHLIDQADDSVVATSSLIGIYSPRTARYDLSFPRDSWWSTPTAVNYFGGSRGARSDIDCRQDLRGTRPDSLTVNIWNLRFLEGQSIESGPAPIQADLTIEKGKPAPAPPGARKTARKRKSPAPPSPPAAPVPAWPPPPTPPPTSARIKGTITNHGPHPLNNLLLRTQLGICTLDNLTVAPGETIQVDKPLAINNLFPTTTPNPALTGYYSYNYAFAYSSGTPPPPATQPVHQAAGDLAADRSERITFLLEAHDDLAVIYAQAQDPAPAVTMHNESPHEQHYQFIRALVPTKTTQK